MPAVPARCRHQGAHHCRQRWIGRHPVATHSRRRPYGHAGGPSLRSFQPDSSADQPSNRPCTYGSAQSPWPAQRRAQLRRALSGGPQRVIELSEIREVAVGVFSDAGESVVGTRSLPATVGWEKRIRRVGGGRSGQRVANRCLPGSRGQVPLQVTCPTACASRRGGAPSRVAASPAGRACRTASGSDRPPKPRDLHECWQGASHSSASASAAASAGSATSAWIQWAPYTNRRNSRIGAGFWEISGACSRPPIIPRRPCRSALVTHPPVR